MEKAELTDIMENKPLKTRILAKPLNDTSAQNAFKEATVINPLRE